MASPAGRSNELVQALDLSPHASARAAELSKGTAAESRARHAHSLHDPDVLLLDEPTSGLDPEVIQERPTAARRTATRGCAILAVHPQSARSRTAGRPHRGAPAAGCWRLDTPAHLRGRLATGRIVIRMAGDAARWLDTVRAARHDAAPRRWPLAYSWRQSRRGRPRRSRVIACTRRRRAPPGRSAP